MPGLRETVRLGLGQHRIGGQHRQRGIGTGLRIGRQVASQNGVATVAQRYAVRSARASDHLASCGVDHVAHRITRHQRAHCHTFARDGRAADAAFHRMLDAKHFAHQRAGSRSQTAVSGPVAAGRNTSRITGLCVGADAGVTYRQIEQHRSRNDGHHAKT